MEEPLTSRFETVTLYKKERCSFMQRPKEELYRKLVDIAREEFFQHGFKRTSMRAIASKSQVGLGNIYNYFKNKDQLLEAVLRPLLNRVEAMLNEHNDKERISLSIFYSEAEQQAGIERQVEFVKRFKKELYLLFLNSHGSFLENYKETLIDKYTESSIVYMRMMKEKYPDLNADLSYFFIHNMCSWWFNIVEEMVSHELSDDQMELFFSEYYRFCTAGWKRVMGV